MPRAPRRGKPAKQSGLTGVLPEPVDGPHGKALRAAARAQHFRNANLVDFARTGVYRDYVHGPQSWTVASVGSKTSAIAPGDVPILTFAGWLDAGTANGVLSQFTSLPNTQQESWIGPWSHGQGHIANPFQPGRHAHRRRAPATQRPAIRVLRPLRRRTTTRPDSQPRAALLHPERGHMAHHHPLAGRRAPGPHRLYFGAGHALTCAAQRRPPGSDLLKLNPTAGTGQLRTAGTPTSPATGSVYPNRAAVDRKLLSYTTAPLRQATP